MSAWRALCALLLLVLLNACAALAPERFDERALAPASAVADRSFQQILVFRRGERERRLIAAGALREGRLVLSLLSPEGLELLRLRQVGTRLQVLRDNGLPRGLTAHAIVADLQLVHWPAESLRAAWGNDWRLAATPARRVASWRGEPRVRVDYSEGPWQGPVVLKDLRRGYRLQVTTIDHQLASPSAGAAE